MGNRLLKKILSNPITRIRVDGGDVFKLIQNNKNKNHKFGELYLSSIDRNHIKAWKKHLKMTSNFFVIRGNIKFVFYDEINKNFLVKILKNNFQESLIVPPGIWFGFKGLNYKDNILMNFANMIHDKNEVLSKKVKEIKYNW